MSAHAETTPEGAVAPPTRSDPRQDRTRCALIRAGMMLFGRNGSESIGIDDLVRAAGVSKQSFYNHFDDKLALEAEVLHLARGRLERLVRQINRDERDPARRLARGMSVYALQAQRSPDHIRLISRLLWHDVSSTTDANHGLSQDIRAGIAQGRFAVFSASTGVAFIVGVGQALLANGLLQDGIESAAMSAQQFVTLALRALGLGPLEAELIAGQAAEQIIRHANDGHADLAAHGD